MFLASRHDQFNLAMNLVLCVIYLGGNFRKKLNHACWLHVILLWNLFSFISNCTVLCLLLILLHMACCNFDQSLMFFSLCCDICFVHSEVYTFTHIYTYMSTVSVSTALQQPCCIQSTAVQMSVSCAPIIMFLCHVMHTSPHSSHPICSS